MKFTKIATIAATAAAATATVIGITGQQANAGTIKGGWNYAIDSFNDGYYYGNIGSSSPYEFYGIAIKEKAEKIYVAINSNLGFASSSNDFIGYGDLMFDFSGLNLTQASNQNKLFAIHFDSGNDSQANAGVGVYSGVKAESVAGSNSGFNKFKNHANSVSNKGGSASMADLAQNDAYFSGGDAKTLNVIQTGTKVGDIEYINDFSQLNLDFGQFGATGSKTFGFSFDRALLPNGDYLAQLLAECANDGMAIAGQLGGGGSEDVPEPITGLIAAAGLGGAALRRMKKQKNA